MDIVLQGCCTDRSCFLSNGCGCIRESSWSCSVISSSDKGNDGEIGIDTTRKRRVCLDCMVASFFVDNSFVVVVVVVVVVMTMKKSDTTQQPTKNGIEINNGDDDNRIRFLSCQRDRWLTHSVTRFENKRLPQTKIRTLFCVFSEFMTSMRRENCICFHSRHVPS